MGALHPAGLGADGARYRFHDLPRLYARDRLEAEEPAADASRARDSMHRWLLETAIVAGRWFGPDHGAPPVTWQGTVDLSGAENARRRLRKAHLAAGQREQARQAFLRCLSLADANPRSTAEAREHLARLGSPPFPDRAPVPPP